MWIAKAVPALLRKKIDDVFVIEKCDVTGFIVMYCDRTALSADTPNLWFYLHRYKYIECKVRSDSLLPRRVFNLFAQNHSKSFRFA